MMSLGIMVFCACRGGRSSKSAHAEVSDKVYASVDDFPQMPQVGDSVPELEDGQHLFCYFMQERDLPEGTFFDDAVDAYNASVVYNGLRSVFDVWERYEDKKYALESIRYAATDMIKDAQIRGALDRCIKAQEAFYSSKPNDDSLCQGAYDSLWETDSLICSRYNVSVYGNLDEEKYWSSLDVKEQITAYKNKYGDNPQEANIDGLEDFLASFESFNERAKWTWAFIKYGMIYKADCVYAEKVLDYGMYSPYLYFLWRFWRADAQIKHYGASTWSSIPNYIYNARRLCLADVTLSYLAEHPNDIVAINQYLVLAHHPNVLRQGEYPFGNEANTEFMYMGLL